MYNPDSWELVKIKGDNGTFYRVFGSWSGGYTQGDEWRFNSGVTHVTEDDTHYHFHGHSGSVYHCHKQGYGVRSAYNRGVLWDYCDRSDGRLERFDEMPDIMNIVWEDKNDQASTDN